jgi:Ca2+ transporting ATPase
MELNSDDKKERLLGKKLNNVAFFQDLFDCDGITEGRSNQKYQEFGGKRQLLNTLRIKEEIGLDTGNKVDIENRRKEYGTNHPEEVADRGLFDFVAECLEDPMLRILIAASIVSLIIGILQEGLATGWIEGTAIFFAVFIVVSITAFNNWSKEKQFNKLNKENKIKFVNVRRDGIAIKEINSEELLVGDILYLRIGDIVTVDGILIQGETAMDESAATGESDLIKKTPETISIGKKNTTPFVLSGTQVQEGAGEMVVCAVGANTFAGRNKEKITANQSAEDSSTPLQIKLTELAGKIGDLGLIMAVFIGVLMIIKELILRIANGATVFDSSFVDVIVNAFIICITVIVVAIPEGLPMAVTISLAFSVMKMKEEHNLVRHLDASETMGNVNNVCTDKTGTLTEGKMSINNVYVFGKNFPYRESRDIHDAGRSIIGEVISNNITSWTEQVDGKLYARGNMTEVALLQYLLDTQIKYEQSKDKPQYLLPFSSEYKFMVSAYPTNSSKYRLYIKGAPERVLNKCTKYLNGPGSSSQLDFKDLTPEVKQAFERQQEIFADQCQRTLVLGYKDLTHQEIEAAMGKYPEKNVDFFHEITDNINLVCLVGIADAPRSDVSVAIANCNRAGVLVRMVTGDNIRTAIAISKQVGILNELEGRIALNYIKNKERLKNEPNSVKEDQVFGNINNQPEKYYALEGSDFRAMSEGYRTYKETDEKGVVITRHELVNVEKFRQVTENLKVIARASPDDKFLLVMGLKKLDNIVAVTGDGTNDAPALKQSHVGFAMGKKGTDIAKEASDIILLDDSFSSIVTAMKYGRNVYDCIRKFLQFQLTTNVVAVFMTLLGGIILKDSPLNAIQMLWVNLIMDSFASLALATEPPTDKLLNRQPYKKDSSIITTMMLINIVTQAVFQIVVLSIIIFYGDLLFGVASDRELSHFTWNNVNGYHFTIFFNIFVFMQVFNSINARKLDKSEINVFEGIGTNYLYIGVQTFIVVGQIFMVQFGGRALRTQPLSAMQHLGCILIASITLVVSLIVKLIPFEVEEVKKPGAPERFSLGMASRMKSRTRSSVLPTSRSIKQS